MNILKKFAWQNKLLYYHTVLRNSIPRILYIICFAWIFLQLIVSVNGENIKKRVSKKGYVLVVPENYLTRILQGFTLGYSDFRSHKFITLGTWKLYNQFSSNTPRWIRADRHSDNFLFTICHLEKGTTDLHVLSIDKNIVWTKFHIPVSAIYGAWGTTAYNYILYSWQGKGHKPIYTGYNTKEEKRVSLNPINALQRCVYGSSSDMSSYEGPGFLWSPGQKCLHLFMPNPTLTLPQLPIMPPEYLYAKRKKSQWFFCGDLRKSFVLYTNPTYAEVKQGLKTRVGIYLEKQKKWKIFDLKGTECYPLYFSKWFVFQVSIMNLKSRPEEFFRYSPKCIGQFVIVNLKNGNLRTLELDKNSTILHVGESTVLVREKDKIFQIPIDSIGITGKKPIKNKLCEGTEVQYVKYAVPVSDKPEIIEVPKDFIPYQPENSKKKLLPIPTPKNKIPSSVMNKEDSQLPTIGAKNLPKE